MNFRQLAFVISATTALSFSPAFAEGEEQPSSSAAKPLSSRTYEFLNLFGDVFERARTDYVEEVDDGELIENAINGMLSSLDPHSSYLNEKSFKDMQIQTKGEFGGLGIEVTMDNGLVKVVSPIDETPAARAGVKAGDYISHIDDEPVMGITLSDAVEKMRGKVGTSIKITILREGLSEPLDLNLVRDVIKIQSVRSQKESDIGYLRITSFSEQTFEKMRDELEKLRTEIPQMKGLVLDLRNNPGGLLDQAVEVSDAFLDRGEIVSTRGRQKEDIHRYSATAGDLLDGLPMVVLINAGSASASEIVAGAMQDHKRAVIMGNKSFGKGSVQTVIPLPGHGAMRLTTSRYYTPSGVSIQAEGIVPDIEVDQAKIELATKDSRRIYESNLPGALSNDNSRLQQVVGKDKAMKDAELKSRRGESKDESVSGSSDSKKLNVAEDFQLARAIDLLRGLAVYKHQAPAVSPTSVSVSAPQPVAEASETVKTPAKAPTNPSVIKPAPTVKPVPEKTKP